MGWWTPHRPEPDRDTYEPLAMTVQGSHPTVPDDGEVKRTWRGAIWDTWDLPKKERKLLFKVDATILTLASIGFFIKVLDQSNINSAFLSGMKEDLGMYGNELVHATSIWTAGYIIGQIPITLLLTRIDPRWVLPSVEIIWGVLTLSSYAVTSVNQLYAIRFFVGLAEAGYYPGLNYLLGSWYTPREIGKRAMIFWLAGLTGQMFSGFLQAAAYNNLDGVAGHAGWRWLFIIDAIITLPVAIIGYIFLPSIPLQSKKTWWLTDDEYHLSRERVLRYGKAGKKPWTWKKLRSILTSWHTWVLPMVYVLWMNAAIQQPMGYWLKSFNVTKNPPVPGKTYSVAQINELPNVGQALFIVVALIWAWLSDGPLRGRRWPFIYLGAGYTIIMAAILRSRDPYKDINGQMALYWLFNIMNGSGPLILSWINEVCADDTEKRAILVAAALDFAYVLNAIAPNFVWKTADFPRAKKGFTYSIILNVLLVIWLTLAVWLFRRDKRRAKLQLRGSISSESPTINEDDDTKALSDEDQEAYVAAPPAKTLV